MKPSILNWIYLVLGYLVLDTILQVVGGFQYAFKPGNDNSFFDFSIFPVTTATAFYFPIFPIITAAASIVAIIGLTRKMAWAKIIAFVVIVVDRFIALSFSVYVYLASDDVKEITDILMSSMMSSLIFSIPLLFLAYKIYTSEPLKIYLSRPQLNSRQPIL